MENPLNNSWNTAQNWNPATVPDSETDVATFGTSVITTVQVGGATELSDAENKVAALVFDAGAPSYTLTVLPASDATYSEFFELYGAGVINQSGATQHILVEAAPGVAGDEAAALFFHGASSAGENVIITNEGSASSEGNGAYGGWTTFAFGFTDTASAGKATFINEGGKVSGTIYGGTTELYAYSTAEAATFINQPGVVAGAAAGHTFLYTGGNIGSSSFINNAATVTGAEGGWTELDIGVCAGATFTANGAISAGPQAGQVYTYGGSGYANFIAQGGRGPGAQGGLIEIHNLCNSSDTIVSAKRGSNGGLGGMIAIEGAPRSLDQVQFRLTGNSTMDLGGLLQRSVVIGSLSGQGTVSLSRFSLSIGSNNLSTTFSGVIKDTGSVTKAGAGTLTLTGANSYSGTTTVTSGTLVIANQSGSGTGTGAVGVTGGTLAGSGTIAGEVTVGTGSGTGGAFVAPAGGTTTPATLTIQNPITFNSDSSYTCAINTRTVRADQIAAKGVTIVSGAQFAVSAILNKRLTTGTVFTVISNTSANPISGAFVNLDDGSTITVGRNKLQASYTGGDGNDLTLTLVP
jgi:autotransporter-associated beta strand protein